MLGSDGPPFSWVLHKMDAVLWAKDEKHPPDCYPRQVQKPAFATVWGCLIAPTKEKLQICEVTINPQEYIHVLEQHRLLYRGLLRSF